MTQQSGPSRLAAPDRAREALPWRSAVLAIVIAVAGFAGLASTAKHELPVTDETEYLRAAHNLRGRLAFSGQPPDAAPIPMTEREPAYPAVLAAVSVLDPAWASLPWHCADAPTQDCRPAFRVPRALNSAFIALAALLCFRIAWLASGRQAAAFVALLVVVANVEAARWRGQILSDYFALFLAALLSWALVEAAVARPRARIALLAVAGTALCVLILTKAIFLYALPVAALACAFWIWRAKARLGAVAGAALLLACAATPVGAWMARNHAAYGAPVVTSMRGSVVLSIRALYNTMTWEEYRCAALWFIRGAGDNWARLLFPPAVTDRFGDKSPQAFYVLGHDVHYGKMKVLTNGGLSAPEAEARIMRDTLAEILADLPKHAAVSVLFFYRGLFIDEFIVLTFPALLVVLWRSRRRDQATTWLALAVGIYAALIHGAVAIGISRFLLPALPALAVAAGLAWPGWAAAAWSSIRRRTHR